MLLKIRKIFNLLQDQRIRFLIGGGFNTFCNIFIFNVLYFCKITKNLDAIFYIASLLSIVISVFVLRFFVFRKSLKIKPMFKTLIAQILIMFFGLIFFNFAVKLNLNPSFSQIFTTLISAISSYFVNKKINTR